MPKIRSLASKLGRVFKLGRPKAPQAKPPIPLGHRGIHMTSRKMREAKVASGQPAYSPEEIAQWMELSPESSEGFANGEPLFVHSSNVSMLQYFPEENKLQVEYKAKGTRPRSGYIYSNISRQEALESLTAFSKGSWVWDRLRVRGSSTAHQKPYQRLF